MASVSICIDVAELKTATAFYREALGCVLEETEETHSKLSLDGITIHLVLKEAGSPATRVGSSLPTFERHWTPVHLDFDVKDVDETAELVLRLGGSVEEVKRAEWGAAAFCADPFGNGFCLIANLAEHSG
ncbi:MAG: VOC family protein [Planctomycetota bacterium]